MNIQEAIQEIKEGHDPKQVVEFFFKKKEAPKKKKKGTKKKRRSWKESDKPVENVSEYHLNNPVLRYMEGGIAYLPNEKYARKWIMVYKDYTMKELKRIHPYGLIRIIQRVQKEHPAWIKARKEGKI